MELHHKYGIFLFLGGLSYQMTGVGGGRGVIVIPLGIKIRNLILLRVFKSKMTTVSSGGSSGGPGPPP